MFLTTCHGIQSRFLGKLGVGVPREVPQLYWDNGTENGNHHIVMGYIIRFDMDGIMENKMETTILQG